MTFWIGTSGFSYKAWRGKFYPEDLPNDEMLSYYAERLNAVEINNTFYRMPSRKVLNHWSTKVSAGFSFVLKASRKITHHKRLRDANDELAYLLDVSSELGDQRGPILFQLPPYLRKDVGRLRDFVAPFPKGFRSAFEFRNATWFDDEVYRVLADAGAALVAVDTGDDHDPPVVRTASYGYARLRKDMYESGDLARWAKIIKDQDWGDVFVFFKHEDDGASPALADRLARELGQTSRRGARRDV